MTCESRDGGLPIIGLCYFCRLAHEMRLEFIEGLLLEITWSPSLATFTLSVQISFWTLNIRAASLLLDPTKLAAVRTFVFCNGYFFWTFCCWNAIMPPPLYGYPFVTVEGYYYTAIPAIVVLLLLVSNILLGRVKVDKGLLLDDVLVILEFFLVINTGGLLLSYSRGYWIWYYWFCRKKLFWLKTTGVGV